jgi:hypothetical protein
VKFVEGAPLLVHERVLVPGFRDHHHHRVLDRPAAHGQQLESVVELRGVRARLVEDGHQLRDVVTEMRTAELGLASAHPVDVPAERIDLAVVCRHPEGLGEVPAGQDVGGETRMDQRQRRCHPLVDEVWIKTRELRRGEHSLVNDGAARKACPMEPIPADPRCQRVAFDDPAKDQEPSLECSADEADCGDEELTQRRQRRAC